MSYSPSLGRWLQVDPVGFAGGDANLYRYVRNDPTGATDPTGLAPNPNSNPDRTVRDWMRMKAYFNATVKGSCGNCFRIRVDIEYEERLVERNGRRFAQWRNLRYTYYHLGEKVPCTGNEIGALAASGKWRVFYAPWKPSGEEPAPDKGSPNSSQGMGGANEASPSTYDPYDSGDLGAGTLSTIDTTIGDLGRLEMELRRNGYYQKNPQADVESKLIELLRKEANGQLTELDAQKLKYLQELHEQYKKNPKQ
jgi:uncharacterized protein RhaS with RHS repeats